MKTLILDTSTSKALFALAEEDLFVAFREFEHHNQLSKNFYTILQDFLKEQGVSVHHMDRFAVGIGPGSYTGTRIAVAAGKSLAFALKKPLMGFHSLKAFLPFEEGPFLIVAEAKYGAHFVLKGEKSKEMANLSTLGFFTFEELTSHLIHFDRFLGDCSHSFLKKVFSVFPLINAQPLKFNPRLLTKVVHRQFSSFLSYEEKEVSPLYFSSQNTQ